MDRNRQKDAKQAAANPPFIKKGRPELYERSFRHQSVDAIIESRRKSDPNWRPHRSGPKELFTSHGQARKAFRKCVEALMRAQEEYPEKFDRWMATRKEGYKGPVVAPPPGVSRATLERASEARTYAEAWGFDITHKGEDLDRT